MLDDLSAMRDRWQVLHLTGELDFQEVNSAYGGHLDSAKVLPFTDRMGEAIVAADLVISRAGASTLAELTADHQAA